MTGLFSALATLVALHTAAAELHVEGGQFKDTQGRSVTLRGMNAPGDAKIPPFMPLTDASMLDALPALGINALRLLFNWEAFEPHPGDYSQTYLDYYTQIIRWAHARGIYTIVDFHQDAMSRVLVGGCGEGFPNWALPTYAKRFVPDNTARCSRWFASMWFDNDPWRAWRGFYRDDNGVQSAYVAMAEQVAQHLANEPGVVGYDLMNEPVGHENKELAPFYERIGLAIRAVHPDAILFLEPHVRVDVGLSSDLPHPSYDNIAYAPHFYDPVVTLLGRYLGASYERPFADMLVKAEQLDAPLFLGEFGTSPDTGGALAYMQTLYDRLDEHFVSGAQWSYTPGWTFERKDGWNVEDLSIIDDTGARRANYIPRPYAQKIAGTPVRQRVYFTDDEPVLELTWVNNPAAGATEIFVPPATNRSGEVYVTSGGDTPCMLRDALHVVCEGGSGGIQQVSLARWGRSVL